MSEPLSYIEWPPTSVAVQFVSSYSGFLYMYALVLPSGLPGLVLGLDARPRPTRRLQTTTIMTSAANARIKKTRIHAGMPATFVPDPVAAASGIREGATVGAAVVGMRVGDADGVAVGEQVGDKVGCPVGDDVGP